MDAVAPYSDACRDREFMWGFLHGPIENAGDPFTIGQTECAIVEAALRAIDQQKSLVIHNPFPAPSLPVAICSSYVYSRHPRIPDSDDPRPLLAFPSKGYVTAFDDFHFKYEVSHSSGKSNVIPREVVNTLSDVDDDWGLYTANTQGDFQFDLNVDYVTPGAAFIDFQKDEWSDYSFDRIEAFCEENPEMPVIFYADEMCPAVEMTCERLGVEPLEVTNDLLTTAAHDPTPTPGESELTTQERILTNGGVDMTFVSAVDADLASLLPDLIELKNELQRRDLAYIDVARSFNRLTKQPFKPEYWTRRAKTDGYWDDVPTYLDRIRQRADNVSGAKGEYLLNYARTANKVQGHLNDRHVLQNVVADAIQRASDDPDTEYVFVLKNEAEVDTLELAVLDMGYTIPENVTVVESNSVSPNPDRPHFILYPPYRDSYLYDFPPSKKVAFLYNDVWDEYVRNSAKTATTTITANYASSQVGDSQQGDVTDYVFDISEIESDIKGHITRTGFSGLNAGLNSDEDDDDQSDDETQDDADAEREMLAFEFDNGETTRMGARAHVAIYKTGTATVNRTTAKNVERGDSLLLVDDAADDIYDVLIKNAHQRDAVRDDESLIEDWRSTLNRGMDERDMDADDVLDAIQEMGSDITDDDTITDWRTGDTIAPDDEEDVRRIIKLFHPELEGSALSQVHQQVWRAVKHIRGLHRRIGRNVQRVVEAELNSSTTASFEAGNVNEEMIKTIARDIEPRTVVGIKTET